MKLKFKHQKFQIDAAAAVCDVFAGQPNISSANIMDEGNIRGEELQSILDNIYLSRFNNNKVVLSDTVVLTNLQRLQRKFQIEPSLKLEGRYNLTVEMETGVGKTYTYIKTMFELNKRYGWSKFIVVVPSIAIREGVFKSFELTGDHFAEEYNKKIRYFIYNSQDLNKLDIFANDGGLNVMIINSQAFNAKGKDARRIYAKLDSFRSRRPIDVIAATNPILIIDEPQSVEGLATKERLKDFKPLLTLRYSATHKKDSIYNLVYRLDALEAYNKRLVKKIAVKGISISGSTGTESYLYLEKINLSQDKPPTAALEFEVKRAERIGKVTRRIPEGFDLYQQSGGLEEYKGYTVSKINGLKNAVEFTNGIIIYAGDILGSVNEEQIRRIQIRETIKSHLERERRLNNYGIKVLSLFFIDEVAKYKLYDESGAALDGVYARIFEEEYQAAISECQITVGESAYLNYLEQIEVNKTHTGYFSIDKKNNRITNSKISNKKEHISDDQDAYDLIMKDKERLLDLKEPVRFIFSHSALREGWDNPNVFQICTLKQSGSDIRKRQEVGRGLRLCVNNNGERMDSNILGEDVHNVNVLTVIANESYESFAKRLQAEITEIVADRPIEVTDFQAMGPENARSNNVDLELDKGKLQMKEFQSLWHKINSKSAYVVDFETNELIGKSIKALNQNLNVSKVFLKVEQGELKTIKSKSSLQSGEAITTVNGGLSEIELAINPGVKYDLIGKVVAETGLTRSTVGAILRGIEKAVFEQFHINPEEFILKATNIINEQKATVIIEYVIFNKLEEEFSVNIFTDPALKVRFGVNSKPAALLLANPLINDSKDERDFTSELDRTEEIEVYVKLPSGFFINTPVGKYNPDWAISFYVGQIKHTFFVAETKGDLTSLQLRKIVDLKTDSALEYFRKISKIRVKYAVVDSYDVLLNEVLK